MPRPHSPETAHRRARVARLNQLHPPGHPELVEAQRDLAASALHDHVERVLASSPRLSDEQLDRIAALLRAGAT
jgi:hypothetical protein